jgi:LPS sulfotransferase NodH
MRLTDVLGRPSEYFSRWVMPGAFPDEPQNVPSWAHLAFRHGRTENGVLSIKIFPEHFQELQREIRFSEWFGSPRWVWLSRLDLVGQAISYVMAKQTRAYQAQTTPITEPRYDGAAIARDVQSLAARDAQWAAYFARTRIAPLRLIYEEIEHDALGTVQKIAEYTGIRLNDPPLRAAVSLQKQRGSLSAEWRERFYLEFGRPDEITIPYSAPPETGNAPAPPSKGPFERWLSTISRRSQTGA